MGLGNKAWGIPRVLLANRRQDCRQDRRHDVVETRATPRNRERGQAILEFLLMLFVALAVMAGVSYAFRKSLRRFWLGIAREVTAPCPDCNPPPEFNQSN
jgi:hypothetical protein